MKSLRPERVNAAPLLHYRPERLPTPARQASMRSETPVFPRWTMLLVPAESLLVRRDGDAVLFLRRSADVSPALGSRQQDFEGRALAGLARHAHAPAVPAHDGVERGQAEAAVAPPSSAALSRRTARTGAAGHRSGCPRRCRARPASRIARAARPAPWRVSASSSTRPISMRQRPPSGIASRALVAEVQQHHPQVRRIDHGGAAPGGRTSRRGSTARAHAAQLRHRVRYRVGRCPRARAGPGAAG